MTQVIKQIATKMCYYENSRIDTITVVVKTNNEIKTYTRCNIVSYLSVCCPVVNLPEITM
jgi:hypothetical protein